MAYTFPLASANSAKFHKFQKFDFKGLDKKTKKTTTTKVGRNIAAFSIWSSCHMQSTVWRVPYVRGQYIPVAVMAKVELEAKGSVGCSGRTTRLGGGNYELAAGNKTLGNLLN